MPLLYKFIRISDSFNDSGSENSEVIKSVFDPSSLDAHVAVLFFYFLALGFCVCDLYKFSTAVFTGNAECLMSL